MIHVSSTEPPLLRKLGERVDTLPEKYGVDVLWYSHQMEGMVGVQRKEFNDLLASIDDGRLAYELGQMAQLRRAVLCVEGDGIWTNQGELVRSFGRPINERQIHGIILGVQNRGVWVVRTDSLLGTCRFVEMLIDWCEKETHGSLLTRPGPRGEWGKATNYEFQLHLLMGVPGIGMELARRIIDQFGGLPWGWTVEKTDLLAIKGLGKEKVNRIWEALEWQIHQSE